MWVCRSQSNCCGEIDEASLEKPTVIQQGARFCSLQSFRCALVANCIKLVDPMLENSTNDIELVKEIGIKLLKNRFSLENVTVIPASEHSLQEDGSSLGAYVSYYAKRICEGLPLFFFKAKSLLMRIFDFTHAI